MRLDPVASARGTDAFRATFGTAKMTLFSKRGRALLVPASTMDIHWNRHSEYKVSNER